MHRRLIPNSPAKADTTLGQATSFSAGKWGMSSLVMAKIKIKMLSLKRDEISELLKLCLTLTVNMKVSQSYTDDVDIFTRAIRPLPLPPPTIACSVEMTNRVRTLTTKTRQHLFFSWSSIHLGISSEPTRFVSQTLDGASLLRGIHALALIWPCMTSSLDPCQAYRLGLRRARARTSSKFLR